MQTEKARQAQQESESSQKSEERSIEQRIAETVAPLQQAISSLQEQMRASATARVQEEQDEDKALRESQADIKNLLKDLDVVDEEDKYAQLTNKQLIDVICNAFDTAVNARSEALKEELTSAIKPQSERVEKLQKVVMSVIAGLGLNEARRKFSDFDEYKDDIGKIMQKYPGIEYEDAYMLAKSQRASSVPPKDETEAEKPAAYGSAPEGSGGLVPSAEALAAMTMRGRAARTSGEPSRSTGIVSFRSFVDQAAEKILSSKE